MHQSILLIFSSCHFKFSSNCIHTHYIYADVALVTSLRDGMNLVSYEFVACQEKKKGVLILSEVITKTCYDLNLFKTFNSNYVKIRICILFLVSLADDIRYSSCSLLVQPSLLVPGQFLSTPGMLQKLLLQLQGL